MESNTHHNPIDPDHQLPPPRPRKSHLGTTLLIVLVILLVVGGIGFIIYRNRAAAGGGSAFRRGGGGPVAVTAVAAKTGDIGVYLEAIGTVTPEYTATITSQANGPITAIHYQEGQLVKKGDPLIDIDPRPYEATLEQAQGILKRDQDLLAQAQMNLERYKTAWARNAIPKQTLDDQEKVVLEDQGTVQNDQGTVRYDEIQVGYCHITAPISGRVGLRLLDPGNIVQANSTTPLVVITQLSPITVVFTISEDNIDQVVPHMAGPTKLIVDALDRTADKTLATGKLLTLDNQIDTTTGTVKARAIFPNADNALFPNQFVNTRLLVNMLKNVTLIPSSAIQHNEQVSFVYVIKTDETKKKSTVSLVNITPGVSDNTMTEVTGIKPGTIVADSGFERLTDKAQVTIQPRGGGSTTRPTSQSAHSHHHPGGASPSTQSSEDSAPSSPSRPFIERPVATSLLMAAILLVGIVCFLELPVSALPQVDYPTIQILTFYPGANPNVVSTTVTAPLERQLGELQGLSQMTSTSAGGVSLIVLEFDLNLNIDVAEQEVQSAINASQSYLPSNLPAPPIYSKSNPADAPVMTLAVTSDTIPLPTVEDLVDTRLAPKISQLTGVGLVSISGGHKPAVRIQANPVALSSYGINMEDLRTALVQSSVNAAKGNFDGPHQNYQIDANDQLVSSDDYKKVVVAYRNGAPVMLTDVARIVNGVENNNQAAWMNLTPAVIVNIQRQPGANTINVVEGIKHVLPSLEVNLPIGLKITTLTDMTTPIRASIDDVYFELGLTVVLVVLVIFLFLRSLSATIIPSVAVPLSIIGTFAAMYLLGYSLDNLSLMALTISTGFVVDDAIVMIENISRFIEAGDSPMEAALKGAEQIGFTIISLTISLIAVLIPLLFMGDVVGRLFREFAVTLAVTIVVSAVVSLTLTPMMSARILHSHHQGEQGWLYRVTEGAFEWMIAFYGRTLQFVLRYQTITLLVALGTMVLTVVLYEMIPKGFFPVQDTGVIQGISQAAPSISATEMAKKQQELAKVVLDDPNVQSLSSFIGPDGMNTTLNSGRFSINLVPLAQRGISASQVIRELKPKLKAVRGIQLFMQPVQNITVDDRVSRTQYQYTLEDADPVELNQRAKEFVDKLQQLPQLADVATDQQNGGLAESLIIDRVTASRLGIGPSAIDNTLYDSFGQRQINTMYTSLNQYHVILEADPKFQETPDSLKRVYIEANTSSGASGSAAANSFSASGSSSAGSNALTGSALYTPSSNVLKPPTNALAQGGPTSPANAGVNSSGSTSSTIANAVPLGAFADFQRTTEPLSINHQGQFPVITISFNLGQGYSLGEAMSAIDKVQKQMKFPPSMQAAYQGTAASFRNSLTNEPLLILAALITVYIVLGVLYESFIHPITILSTLPSAGVGALLALMMFHQDLSVVAIIGIVLLIGIVKKNGIMMVDFALEAERKGGKNAADAIYEACLLRFRPIMMTTMAALLAGIPLACGTGIGSELRRPLGIAMVGGLILSQALTLYTTPVIYIFFDNLAQRFGRRLDKPNPNVGAAGESLA